MVYTPVLLIVEPAPELRSSLCLWLGSELPAYRILTAECGEEALWITSEERPTHFLIEIQLPDINAFDLVKPVRAIVPTARIALTGWHESQFIVTRVRSTGADRYIPNYKLHSELVSFLTQADTKILP